MRKQLLTVLALWTVLLFHCQASGAVADFVRDPTLENLLRLEDSIVTYGECNTTRTDCFKAFLDPPVVNFGKFEIRAMVLDEIDRDVTIEAVQNIVSGQGFGFDAVGVSISTDRREAVVQMDIQRDIFEDLVDPFDGIIATAEFILSESGLGQNALQVEFGVQTFLTADGELDQDNPDNPSLILDDGEIVPVTVIPNDVQIITYDFPLSTNEVVGASPVFDDPAPTGRARLTYNPFTDEITDLEGTFENLTGDITSIGLYGPAGAGEEGPAIALLPADMLAELMQGDGSFEFFPGTMNNFELTQSLASALASGNAYVQIETATNPLGEIRGQVVPVVPVPEPASAVMAIMGIALALTRRRRTH